jgi:hypothetical protein
MLTTQNRKLYTLSTKTTHVGCVIVFDTLLHTSSKKTTHIGCVFVFDVHLHQPRTKMTHVGCVFMFNTHLHQPGTKKTYVGCVFVCSICLVHIFDMAGWICHPVVPIFPFSMWWVASPTLLCRSFHFWHCGLVFLILSH